MDLCQKITKKRSKNMNKNIHILSRAVIIDENHILLCKTVDRPNNFYFLPGGHVEHGESCETALIRELIEETGQNAEIKRFLGCLEYSFEPGYSSHCHNHEYNFVFEARSDNLKRVAEIPQLEDHIIFVWIPLIGLTEIDFRAEPFKELLPKWLAQPSSEDSVFTSVMV